MIVVLGEGYTASERTLFEAGRWYEVRNARQIWQDDIQELFVAPALEDLDGRKVAAFLSADRRYRCSRSSSVLLDHLGKRIWRVRFTVIWVGRSGANSVIQ